MKRRFAAGSKYSWQCTRTPTQSTRHPGFSGAFTLLAIGWIANAGAQPTPPVTPAPVEELVITAAKRSSTVQKTPISITAISGADLQRRGLTSVTAVAQEVPGVSMKSSGPGQTEFEMRGLSSSGGSSPTVGFYLNDTPLTAPASAQNGKVVIDPNLYDLNRIEVLRGPQGTLYGSGSMGGTIKLITNAPNTNAYAATAQSILSGTAGGGFNHGENAMVNIPLISDTLALRLVGSEDTTSGWIDRIVASPFPLETNGGLTRGPVQAAPVTAIHRDVNDESLLGGRATLLWQPTEHLTITPSIFWQQIQQGGPNTFDSDPATLAHYQPFDVAEPFRDRFLTEAVTARYTFDTFDVVSTTAHWSRGQTINQDGSENLQLAFGLPDFSTEAGGAGGNHITEIDLSRQFSEELRVTSTGNTRFQWLLGGFYSDFESDWDIYWPVPDAVGLFGTTNFINQVQPTRINQKALFGEASYGITQQLRATVGLRFYSFDSTVDTAASGLVSQSGSNVTGFTHAGEYNQGFNPRFNLAYTPAPDLLVYTTAARGFRPGGGNQPIPVNPASALGAACLASLQALGRDAAPDFYQPDDVWSYEAGGKLRLGDRVTLNGAAYYETWKGVQQTVALTCGFPYTDNAGDAAVKGGEVELRARLPAGLTLDANAAYTNAYLTRDVQETGGHRGDMLQDIPPWTASASLLYSVPVAERWQANLRATYDFEGIRRDATYYPMNHLPAYSLVNIRASLSDDRWVATLFVNNLFNKKAWISDAPSLSINLPTFNRVTTNQPLTVGLDLSYRFR